MRYSAAQPSRAALVGLYTIQPFHVGLNRRDREEVETSMPMKLRNFLDNFLALMKEDFPQQLHEIIEDSQGITCLQTLDSERAVIQIQKRRIKITDETRKKNNIQVTLSRNCLFKIIEGEITLAEAFHTKEFDVIGDPLTLLRCHRMWMRIISVVRTSPRFFFLTYQLR
jgi:putative sterol carrier protein